jgi:hypothetical protein
MPSPNEARSAANETSVRAQFEITVNDVSILLESGRFVVQIIEDDAEDAQFVARTLRELLEHVEQTAYAAGMARMRWIRVSEQLPELDKAVLCYGQGVYWVAHLRGHFVPRDRMQWEYGGEMVPVDAFTHWAELAAPGAEGEKP